MTRRDRGGLGEDNNRGENKNDVGVMYVISNALRTKILIKNDIKKY